MKIGVRFHVFFSRTLCCTAIRKNRMSIAHGTSVVFDTEMKSALKVNFKNLASFSLSADSISVKYHGVLL